MGPDQSLSEASPRDAIGREDGIGSGPAELFRGALFSRPGDNGHAGIQRFGGKNHKDVVGIGGQGSDKTTCAFDTRLPQASVAWATRCSLRSTTRNEAPARWNSEAALRPTRPSPQTMK